MHDDGDGDDDDDDGDDDDSNDDDVRQGGDARTDARDKRTA
jgi:hypothetical protein